jgi:hypothetical protein
MRHCTYHSAYRDDCSSCRRAHRNGGYGGMTIGTAAAVTSDNLGRVDIDPISGDLEIGIGGGLTMDVETGEVGFEVAPGLAINPSDF